MDTLAHKYNRFLITIVAFSPFVAFLTLTFLGMSYLRIIQLLSYLGIILLLIFKPKGESLKIPNYLIFYFLFIIYVFYSDLIMLNRAFKVSFLFGNVLIGGFNFMFIIENLKLTKKHFKFIMKWSEYILIVAILLILLQQGLNNNIFVNNSLFDESSTEFSETEVRLHSIYSWINLLSNGFGFVPIFILIVSHSYSKKKKVALWIIAGLTYSLLTKDRWILVNALLVGFVLIINHKNKARQIAKLFLIAPLLLFVSYVVLNFLGLNVKGIVEDRILESDKSINEKSAGTRIIAIRAFDRFYWDNPIWGIGNIKYGMGTVSGKNRQDYKLRTFLKGRSSQIHIGYLSLFYMYGLVGGFLFMAFLILLVRSLYKDAKKTTNWGPYLGFLGFVLANITLVSFSVLEMGLIIVLFANKYYLISSMEKNNQIV